MGSRVVVPKQCRKTLFDLLHESHMGVSNTKTLARQYFWWPKMDSDVESVVKSCPSCQMIRPTLTSTPIILWEFPKVPFN